MVKSMAGTETTAKQSITLTFLNPLATLPHLAAQGDLREEETKACQ